MQKNHTVAESAIFWLEPTLINTSLSPLTYKGYVG